MSFWFPGRKRGARRFLYSASAPILQIIVLTVMVLLVLGAALRRLFNF